MPGFITASRAEVSKRWPIVGLRYKTNKAFGVEIALATDAKLFRPESKALRTAANFYTTRSVGPLPAERGEGIYLVPPQVLQRFAGQARLYYTMAVFPSPDLRNPEINWPAPEATPFVSIAPTFTGVVRGGMSLTPAGRGGPGYRGSSEVLEWAGDQVVPGKMEAAAPPAPAAPVAAASGYNAPYSDGLDDAFWSEIEQQDAGSEGDEDAGDGGSIDEPIPDGGLLSAGQSYARALEASEYPSASRFEPAASVNYWHSANQRTIDKIVIHITDGGRSINGTIGWFKNPNQGVDSKGQPIHVSAHYVIGQDGEVVQMVHHNDVAWHAGCVNGRSIGIEHVANTKGLVPTEDEYAASAALVRWLCDQYGIPIDRDHIQGHAEAQNKMCKKKTTHTPCPDAVWDWTHYMELVNAADEPQAVAESLAYGPRAAGRGRNNGRAVPVAMRREPARPFEAVNFLWDDVQMVTQQSNMSCWAAAAAMVVGWRERICIDEQEIAAGAGRWAEYLVGLAPEDVEKFARRWKLVAEQPACYTVDGFRRLLEANGPLWVGINAPQGPHAVTVKGLVGDGTVDGTAVIYNDPAGQENAQDSFRAFMQMFEDQATVDANGRACVQILHGNGRLPVSEGQGVRVAIQRRAPAQPFEAVNFIWHDVQMVPQRTDYSCWAAAAAMVVGWRDRISIDPEEIARGSGHWAEYHVDGLWPQDHADLGRKWKLAIEQPACYTVAGFARLLQENGPLWVGILTPEGDGHAVTAKGVQGDGNPDGTTVIYNDPAIGENQMETFTRFMQMFENRMVIDDNGNACVQILHANGRRPIAQSQGLRARTLALSAFAEDGVNRMRSKFVANAAAGTARQNCITITNAGLRELYGPRLLDGQGKAQALGSTIQDTMGALQGYGLALPGQVFEFLDANGRLTKGVARPERLRDSPEAWLSREAAAEQRSAWYCFGLSIMDGYHSVVLALAFSGAGDPATRLYWCDQIYSGWEDVTGGLDDEITTLTQRWWDGLPANRKARTRVTVWPLLP